MPAQTSPWSHNSTSDDHKSMTTCHVCRKHIDGSARFIVRDKNWYHTGCAPTHEDSSQLLNETMADEPTIRESKSYMVTSRIAEDIFMSLTFFRDTHSYLLLNGTSETLHLTAPDGTSVTIFPHRRQRMKKNPQKLTIVAGGESYPLAHTVKTLFKMLDIELEFAAEDAKARQDLLEDAVQKALAALEIGKARTHQVEEIKRVIHQTKSNEEVAAPECTRPKSKAATSKVSKDSRGSAHSASSYIN